MCKPLRLEKVTDISENLRGVLSNILSAESALNMYPSPIEGVKDKYLSESDEWAKHAMEHLRAAFSDLAKIQEESSRREDIRRYNRR